MIFSIRSMTEMDIDNVYAIEKNVHVAPWSRDILRDCVRVGYDCRVLEINTDNNPIVVGYIICRINNNCAHILNFCIAKSFQSKGYGRKFLKNILNSLIQLSRIDSVVLEVRPSNKTALGLYHSMGFEQVEIKSAYYTDNDKPEDAILLKKTVHL